MSDAYSFGRVVEYRHTGTYAVALDDRTLLQDCIWVGGALAAMSGVHLKYTLPVSARVVVMGSSPGLILGVVPGPYGDPATRDRQAATGAFGLNTTLTGMSSQNATGRQIYDECDPLSDQLPGELVMQNAFSVGIQIMTHFAKLSAGELAKVECHVLTDMVRIVSDCYRHHSSFGDFQITNDGRLNVIWNGTSYPHEAAGLVNPTDKKFTADTKGVDFSDLKDLTSASRDRFSQYIGFLGNFIHVFVTDPTSVLGEMSKTALRSGKFSAHVDMDGSLLIGSVGDIVLERKVRIVVPIQLKHPEDPTGVMVGDYAQLNKEFLKLWKYPKDPRKIFETTYQLREYSRFLDQFQGLSRFHQMATKGEYHVPSEEETPAPDWRGKQADVEETNGYDNSTSYDTYACTRIMRDGSIIHWDGTGSCVVMSHGDVHVAATRHLTLEAAGDVRIIAGGSLYMKARKNVEISATVGWMKLKARAAWQALCEWGTMWFKSDANTANPETAENTEEDPAPIVGPAAIVFETTKGGVKVASKGTVYVDIGKCPEEPDPSFSVKTESGGFIVDAKKDIQFTTQKLFHATARGKGFLFKGPNMLLDGQKFQVGKYAELGVGGLKASQVNTRQVISHGAILGPEIPGPSPGGHPHHNHILKLRGDEPDWKPEPLELESEPVDWESTAEGKLKFAFSKKEEYVPDPYTFMESPAQQFLRLDMPGKTALNWAGSYTEIETQSERLKPADNVDSSTSAFPGSGAQFRQHNGGESLHKPSAKSGADLNKTTDLVTVPFTFTFLKTGAKYLTP